MKDTYLQDTKLYNICLVHNTPNKSKNKDFIKLNVSISYRESKDFLKSPVIRTMTLTERRLTCTYICSSMKQHSWEDA